MRVSIARALVSHPPLLLMDEPFAALDEITRFKLNDDLLTLHGELATTIIFVTHSVYESVYLSSRIAVMASRPGRINVGAETDRILELTGLTDVADKDVADIPTGRARVVELARALMTSPSVVLLDEPASGQTERETELFGELLKRLAADGLAICLVEHDVNLVMQVCSEITVLDYGAVLAYGTPEEIRRNTDVITAYLGTTEGAA